VNNFQQLRMESVSKTFMQGNVLISIANNITYSFEQRMYGIMGVSGTGKSTLLHMLAGLEKPSDGGIFFNNTNIERLHSYLLNSIGIVFQQPQLIPELTVLENVMIKGIIAGQSTRDNKRAYELLERVGMSDRAHSRPDILSGGEQQRIAVLRALYLKPAFLLADEPTAHLDENHKAELLEIIRQLHTQEGMGVILTTHDEALAHQCEIPLRLSQGTLWPLR
jgi:lipoprotein-releasing system ATP-binding protein